MLQCSAVGQEPKILHKVSKIVAENRQILTGKPVPLNSQTITVTARHCYQNIHAYLSRRHVIRIVWYAMPLEFSNKQRIYSKHV